jgi:hypothetical protein
VNAPKLQWASSGSRREGSEEAPLGKKLRRVAHNAQERVTTLDIVTNIGPLSLSFSLSPTGTLLWIPYVDRLIRASADSLLDGSYVPLDSSCSCFSF